MTVKTAKKYMRKMEVKMAKVRLGLSKLSPSESRRVREATRVIIAS